MYLKGHTFVLEQAVGYARVTPPAPRLRVEWRRPRLRSAPTKRMAHVHPAPLTYNLTDILPLLLRQAAPACRPVASLRCSRG